MATTVLFGLYWMNTTPGPAQSLPERSPPPLLGVPGITHYTRKDFHGDPQFWDVCEDKNGVLYFGNNDGAIIFDGEQWYKISLPNNSSIRCLVTDKSGKVYAGGFNEFGLIKKDETGRYYYESLFDTLKFKDPNLENLWQVHALSGSIIYRSFSKLIVIAGNKVTKLPAKSAFIRSFVIEGQYFVQDRQEGIFLLNMEEMQFVKYFSPEQYHNEQIVAMLPALARQKAIAISKPGKIFLFDLKRQTSRLWKKLFNSSENDEVECAIRSTDNTYYLGTLSSGIITLDKSGNIYQEEQNLKDLQDKTVLSLFQNSGGNIWALLNNGLDCINFNSPVTTLFENASLYDVLIQDDRMYLATNQGVFYSDSIYSVRPRFKKIDGLEGQGWSLQQVENDILASHDKGLFLIRGTAIHRIGDFEGIWKVMPLKGKNGLYLAGSYHGLYLIEKTAAGQWRALRKISGFEESSRDILETATPGTFWVCHGYKGVFRVNIDEAYTRVTSLEHFTTQNGLSFPFNINVFRWEGEAVFTTNQGIYSFNHDKDLFEPFSTLNKILDPAKNTRKLIQHKEKTWFVQDDEAGYFITGQDHPALKSRDFLQFKGTFNRGMECIVPLDNQQVLFGTKKGLYLFDLKYQNSHQERTTHITGIRYAASRQRHWLPLKPAGPVVLPNTTGLLRFEFAAPGMQHDADIQYSHMLEGVDDHWSAWQNGYFTEYNHLRPGSYTFRVKSRSLLGMSGKETAYYFEILPVWYQTAWAWVVYLLTVIVFIVLISYLVKRKIAIENQKTREQEQKARKLLELEIQQMRLKSEKERIRQDKEMLEEDVIHKSKELANYTMLLVKKREVISELRQDLKELREYARNEDSRRKVREMVQKISLHMTNEEYLQVFEANFEKVHQDFFTRLKTLFPDLTQRELRLCAFVKMNLTNKEISPMLNISVRGVETARYRVRKKLNLEYEHSLVEYLGNLSSSGEAAVYSGYS